MASFWREAGRVWPDLLAFRNFAKLNKLANRRLRLQNRYTIKNLVMLYDSWNLTSTCIWLNSFKLASYFECILIQRAINAGTYITKLYTSLINVIWKQFQCTLFDHENSNWVRIWFCIILISRLLCHISTIVENS